MCTLGFSQSVSTYCIQGGGEMSTGPLLVANNLPWTADKWPAPIISNNTTNNTNATETNAKKSTDEELWREVALRELREDEEIRTDCLGQFREWIRQNHDLEDCLTDDNFLIRFLRVKKYSVPMAEQMFLKYLNFRKRFHYIMYNMDYTDDKVYDLIRNGYIYCSPYRDANGRRVVLYNVTKFDPHAYNYVDMTRAHVITYETLVAEEETQIMGVNHVADLQGLGPPFLTMWSVNEFARLIRWGEQSFPMRHKDMNMLNLPAAFKYVYDFGHSNIKSRKLRERFAVHTSLAGLHERVTADCLPLEMGGKMPAREMVALWLEELAAKRQRIMSYDKMRLLSDRGIISSRAGSSITCLQDGIKGVVNELPGSFRKLQVD